MKTFLYRGYHRDGGRARGVIEALDVKDAREKLARENIFPDRIDAAIARRGRSSRVSWRQASLARIDQRAELYRALHALMRAGLPLSNALNVTLVQPGEGESALTQDVAAIRDRIRDGATFAGALREAGAPVSGFEEAVIESGERTGRLGDVLEDVANYLDDAGRIRQTLKTASIYPAIILCLSILIAVGVMGFLVPKLSEMLISFGQELPAITLFFMAAGRLFFPVILPVALLAGLAGYAGMRRLWKSPAHHAALERWISRSPLLGRGFHLLVTTRFARTCALLLGGGVSMVEAVGLAGRSTGSVWLGGMLAEKSEDIRHGQSLSQAINDVPVLNQHLLSWIKAGEAAGDIPGMFRHAAGRYQQLWTNYVQRAITIIEPALILLIAVFVLLVALAILLPIMTLDPTAV